LIKRLTFLGGGKIMGFLPAPIAAVFFFAIFHHFILSRTILDRRIYAVGSNEEAVGLSGINKDRAAIITYFSGICSETEVSEQLHCMNGFMAAVAGIMLMQAYECFACGRDELWA
jgi:ribose/xylose/arabinose/galactoside ABC-type transport system permease subunit